MRWLGDGDIWFDNFIFEWRHGPSSGRVHTGLLYRRGGRELSHNGKFDQYHSGERIELKRRWRNGYEYNARQCDAPCRCHPVAYVEQSLFAEYDAGRTSQSI